MLAACPSGLLASSLYRRALIACSVDIADTAYNTFPYPFGTLAVRLRTSCESRVGCVYCSSSSIAHDIIRRERDDMEEDVQRQPLPAMGSLPQYKAAQGLATTYFNKTPGHCSARPGEPSARAAELICALR